MTLPPDFSRTAQLLSEPSVVASLENLARSLGVPFDAIPDVVRDTQRTARGALVRVQRSGPAPFGADLDETPDVGWLDPVRDPPEDPIRFVCWLHEIASRKAVRRARPAWIEAWRGPDADEPPLAFAQPERDEGSGSRDRAANSDEDALATERRVRREDTALELKGETLWDDEAWGARRITPLLQKLATFAVVVAVAVALAVRA
jgi:hypothetical protein